MESESSVPSVQLRIDKIANGYLLRSGGPPLYCKDEFELQSQVDSWLARQIPSLNSGLVRAAENARAIFGGEVA